METKEIIKARKQNMKIYSLYRALSLDLIFYYAIEFLFLTQVKQIDPADVVLGQAFYAIFMVILQIPASMIVDKIGTRTCTILANVFNSIFVILIMFCNNLEGLIFAQFISSICFSLKDISDRALIQYSIPKSKKEGEIFARLEGKAFKDYYLINAITSVCSGFLYVLNPYIPMIGCLGFTIISIFISLGFRDIEEEQHIEKQTTKKYLKDLVKSMKFIVNSQRLRSLFLYGGIAWGIFCLMSTYQTSLLVDIGVSEQFITIIAAIMGVASAYGSKRQRQFHNHFRNKSLSVILMATTISILVAGIMGLTNFSYGMKINIIVIAFAIINIVKGTSGVLSSRYLGNFANDKILTQIIAVNAMSKNIFRAVIGLVGSYLLRITDTANSLILVGLILLVAVLGLISYMKVRLGKKPDEYDEQEIYGKKVKTVL